MRLDFLNREIATAQKAQPELKKLKKASQGIESMFVKDLLTAMRKSVHKTNWGKDFGGDIYQDMFDQSLAESAGKTSMIGIGKMLNDQFAKAVWREAAVAVRRDQLDNGRNA